MTCSPRPVSARQPGSCGTGGLLHGSAPMLSRQGPDCTRSTLTGHRNPRSARAGRAYLIALVSNSETTTTMSSVPSVTPHPRSVALVKSLASPIDLASDPGACDAIRGPLARRVSAGSVISDPFPPARAAISRADASQGQSVPPVLLPTGRNGRAVIAPFLRG